MAKSVINNELYHDLGDEWYKASDHPIALLRKEATFKTHWILDQLREFSPASTRVLDIGCGAGFISNAMAEKKWQVCGIDLSESSLEVAKKFDRSRQVQYLKGDAHALPFEDSLFDIVMCLDVLEHVSDPAKAIKEAARVLKPSGIFFFHTMNRNLISYFVALKGVEWFVKNTPRHLHVYSMFIKPKELEEMCQRAGMKATQWTGLRPRLNGGFFRLLRTGVIDADFEFVATPSRAISYMGIASKR